jgi:SET domain-containing protein
MTKTIQASRPLARSLHFKNFHKVEARKIIGKKNYFGLFAKNNISKGELLFFARGKRVHNIDNDDAPDYPDAIRVSPNTWIVPGADNPLTYTNHSCSPNAGILGRVSFRAIKNIPKDSEICFDYAISECDQEWFMEEECICGNTNCRKIITSIQSLPKKTFTDYLPYIPSWLQKVYKKNQA